MRLIDADELKKRAEEICFPDMPDCGNFYAVGVPDIDIMPTIDPESLRPTAHWASVKDRLPDPDEKVIVYNAENEGTFFARRIESDFKCWDAVTREFVNWRWIPYGYTCITLESVTHWMPLPNPPVVTP